MRKFLCVLLGGAVLLGNSNMNISMAAENELLIESESMEIEDESMELEDESVEIEDELADLNIEYVNYDMSDYAVSIDTKMAEGETAIPELQARDLTMYMNVHCLSKLNDAERALWFDLYNMAMTYATTTRNARINVGEKIYFLEPVSCHGIDADRAKELVDMFLYQCPQFYFLNQYRRSQEVSENNYEISLGIYKEFIDGEVRAESSKKFFSKVDSFVDDINQKIKSLEKSNDYEIAKIVHNKVCSENVYDTKKDGTQNAFLESAWSSVILGEAVCAGYAKLYTILANAIGIETIGVTSWSIKAKISNLPVGVLPVPHAWNKSYVNGNWYVVDTTWDDDPDGKGTVSYDCFLVDDNCEKFKKDTAHDYDDFYYGVAPIVMRAYDPSNEAVGEVPARISDIPVSVGGVLIAAADKTGVVAGAVASFIDKNKLEYRWFASEVGSDTENLVSDWEMGNEWLSWKPGKSGNYKLKCQVRYNGVDASIKECETTFEYKKEIKGICQMPYEGEGGGYLIGIETFDNPNQSYKYEMLILDCTLLAQGKDAWVYTTGKCGALGNCLWTVWQPQYGYYWTLFRVFNENDELIDELCYGFVNAY